MARTSRRLVICLKNSGYEVSLERRKIYVAVPDSRAERLGQIRVIDESGEDYCIQKNYSCRRIFPRRRGEQSCKLPEIQRLAWLPGAAATDFPAAGDVRRASVKTGSYRRLALPQSSPFLAGH
jgi:hypothetical protein